MHLAVRIFAVIMAVLFVVSAFLQINDPDPIVWMAEYLAAAAVCIVAIRGRPVRAPALGLLGLSLLWAILLAPDFLGKVAPGDLVQGMKADRPEIEEAREAGGLSIIVVTMAVLALASRPPRHD